MANPPKRYESFVIRVLVDIVRMHYLQFIHFSLWGRSKLPTVNVIKTRRFEVVLADRDLGHPQIASVTRNKKNTLVIVSGVLC